MKKETPNAILLISCTDQKGLVARVTDFIYENGGNIEDLDQHVDKENSIFFMRLEWSIKGFSIDRRQIASEFKPIAEKFSMNWNLYFSDNLPRAAIFVSKDLHCLYDILFRYREGKINVDIPLIISNHPEAGSVAESFGIEFHLIEKTKENKSEQEKKELELLEKKNIEFIVLARYMQILTGQFIEKYPQNIINIHHSFLPAFIGAKPYEQAFRRGVKIIGATSHYVTEELDAGPIIEQDVARISHRDTVEDLVRKGEDLEKVVLSRALRWHIERKILVYGPKTNLKTVILD